MLNLIVLGDRRVQPWSGVVIFDQSKSICGLLLAHLLNFIRPFGGSNPDFEDSQHFWVIFDENIKVGL